MRFTWVTACSCQYWCLTNAICFLLFFSSRRRHTRSLRDWSSDVCSSDLAAEVPIPALADWCVIDLLQPDGSLHRAAMAARDPELARLIEPLRDHPDSRGPGRA